VYGWIWRKLPFGVPGKIIGSLLLAGGTVALLWFVAFPKVEPLLPFNHSTIDDQNGGQDTQHDGTGDRVSDDPSDYKREHSPTPNGSKSKSGD
jgi:hypothetical protein